MITLTLTLLYISRCVITASFKSLTKVDGAFGSRDKYGVCSRSRHSQLSPCYPAIHIRETDARTAELLNVTRMLVEVCIREGFCMYIN